MVFKLEMTVVRGNSAIFRGILAKNCTSKWVCQRDLNSYDHSLIRHYL